MSFKLTFEVVDEVPSWSFRATIHPDTQAFIEHAREVLVRNPGVWVKVLEADTAKEAGMMSGRMNSHKQRLTDGVGGQFTFSVRGNTVYAKWTATANGN